MWEEINKWEVSAMVKQIIVGTDGSTESMAGFHQAVTLARQIKAGIKCVFIVDLRKTQMPFIYSGAAYEGAYERLYVPPDASLRTFYDKLAEDLQNFAAQCTENCRKHAENEGVEFESVVKSGYPGVELCNEARSGGLLVVGRRGENAEYKRSIVGSITEDLVRVSPRPLLVCPAFRKEVNTIVFPYDGRKTAEQALQYYVNGLTNIAQRFVLLVADEEGEEEPMVEEELDYLERHDVPVEVERRKGMLSKEALKLAEEISADMILLGAKGKPRLQYFLVGSRALYVLQNAEVPVLIVR
ncbi:MAG: universal stress protein [Spirochaetales bacterium]|nr:universal stress protein [Spirochaetales bacterium]